MDLVEDDQGFLRDLVKSSRQKTHVVKWTDRDGSKRQTMLTQAESARINAIAAGLRVSSGEVLRQAAHIPVVR